jgi:hypothetical protein
VKELVTVSEPFDQLLNFEIHVGLFCDCTSICDASFGVATSTIDFIQTCWWGEFNRLVVYDLAAHALPSQRSLNIAKRYLFHINFPSHLQDHKKRYFSQACVVMYMSTSLFCQRRSGCSEIAPSLVPILLGQEIQLGPRKVHRNKPLV